MPTPKSPARNRLDELLADGEWHDREQLVRALMPLIPPGQAVRTATRNRAGKRRRRAEQGMEPTPKYGRPADEQTVGARTCAYSVIATAVRFHTAERRTVAGRIQIRRTPPKDTPT